MQDNAARGNGGHFVVHGGDISTLLKGDISTLLPQGIVFAGTGAGLISSFEKLALKTAMSSSIDSRPVFVRSSRTGNGRVVARDEYDSMGMIPADTLNPQKARILLMLALTKTQNLDEIRRIFTTYRFRDHLWVSPFG